MRRLQKARQRRRAPNRCENRKERKARIGGPGTRGPRRKDNLHADKNQIAHVRQSRSPHLSSFRFHEWYGPARRWQSARIFCGSWEIVSKGTHVQTAQQIHWAVVLKLLENVSKLLKLFT